MMMTMMTLMNLSVRNFLCFIIVSSSLACLSVLHAGERHPHPVENPLARPAHRRRGGGRPGGRVAGAPCPSIDDTAPGAGLHVRVDLHIAVLNLSLWVSMRACAGQCGLDQV